MGNEEALKIVLAEVEKFVFETKMKLQFMILALFYTELTVEACQQLPSLIHESKGFTVISLVSFNETNIPENVMRFHLRLRYFIGRQTFRRGCSKIGFYAFNICGNREVLIAKILEINLSYLHRRVISILSFLPAPFTRLTAVLFLPYDIPYLAYEGGTGEHHDFVTSTSDVLRKDMSEIMNFIKQANVHQVLLLSVNKGFGAKIAQFHLKQYWKEMKSSSCIEITKIILNSYNTTSLDSFVNWLKSQDHIKIIITWSDFVSRTHLIKKLGSFKDRFWFWYSETSFNNFYFHDIDPQALETHIFRHIPAFAFQSLNRKFKYSKMDIELRSIDLGKVLKDPWLNRYFENWNKNHNKTKNNETQPTLKSLLFSFDDTESMASEVTEATILPLWWSQPFRRLCSLRLTRFRMYVKWLTETRNIHVVFENGKYKKEILHSTHFYNFKDKRPWTRKSCPAGRESAMVTSVVNETTSTHMWKCFPCVNGFVKESFGNQSCHGCKGYYVADKIKSSCYDPYIDIFLEYGGFSNILFLIIDSICGVYGIITMLIFIHYKHTPVIRASDFPLAMTQITSHILLCACLPLFYFGKPHVLFCFGQITVTGVIIIFMNSITLLKSHKVLFIFKSKKVMSKKTVNKVKRIEYAILLFVEIAFIGICIITFSYGGVYIESNMVKITLTREHYCSNFMAVLGLFGYLMLIMLISFVQSFRARKLPKSFNESKEILYASFVKFILLSIFFPIQYGQKNELDRKRVELFTLAFLNGFDLIVNHTGRLYCVIFKKSSNDAQSIRKRTFEKAVKKAEKMSSQTSFSVTYKDYSLDSMDN